MTDHKNSGISYRDTLKSMDTEEHIDLAFYRPIGYAWACLAKKLGITPNAITIASIFLGLAAGYLFYFPERSINIVGILLLVWANSFDSADGQLARMTGQYSRIGRILDGLSSGLWFIAIYVAICLRENATSDFFMAHKWVIWLLAVTTGMCHSKQAAMADYYRLFHLYFLKGPENSEFEDSESLQRQLDELTGRKNLLRRAALKFYTNYSRQQEKTVPAMQQLRRELARRFPDGHIPQAFREAFRRKSLPLMKYTNILSFNWRTIALFTALLIGLPWLYFVFELTVLNVLLIYMVVTHERICRTFTARLERGEYGGR